MSRQARPDDGDRHRRLPDPGMARVLMRWMRLRGKRALRPSWWRVAEARGRGGSSIYRSLRVLGVRTRSREG